MALRIYSSNHIETLQQSMSSILSASPLKNPFAAETIVTPTYAMARWLNLQLARELGVAANINYLRPSQWFWQLAQQYLPELADDDVYSRSAMSWQLYYCLQSLPETATFENIRNYCKSDEAGIKRWQLAERLADCFERYQWYRPEMIEDWSNGNENHWQAELWRLLVARLGPHHRPYQVNKLVKALSASESATTADTRLSLFALSELPPLYLSVIQAFAEHCQLHLFIHSPTDQYWADLRSQKQLGQQRLQHPEYASLFETGNELLSAWGRQGQIFQDLLLQADITESIDVTLYQPPGNNTLLEKIQASIFAIEQQHQPARADDSVSIHVCHSVMRECQVLHDQLLDLLDREPQLQPEDILVMIPNISAYAASIESVFRYQNTHGLACNLSDLSLSHEHPSVVSFLQLIRLADSRFSRSEILGLLDNPGIRFQFGIDSQGYQDIMEFINKARVKWGINGTHKTSFGLPATEENTWQQARQRFYAGYAFADSELWNGIALLPFEDTSQSQQIGRFWFFFDQLCEWKNRFSIDRPTAEWRILLNDLVTQFLGDSESTTTSIQQIRNGINNSLPDSDITLSPQLVLQLLEKQLYQVEQPGQLYSGGVTFCGLRPMRNIPFKVICLLGMNHDEFPRNDRPLEFDLMHQYPRGGDPGFRMQDRYLMLETLLCCREKLYISYTGRSAKDNSELPPSTLVDELLDYIDRQFSNEDQNGQGIVSLITRHHPMQAYSPRQFVADHFSFSHHWYEISQALQKQQPGIDTGWPQQRVITIDAEPVINVDDLRRFLQHPIRYFFSEMLGIRLFTEQLESDEETFELDGLQRWQLRQQLANNHLQQIDDSLLLMQAEGQLPHGAAASSSFDRLSAETEEWLSQLDDYRGLPKQTVLVKVHIDSAHQLSGRVGNYYAGVGLMSVYAGRLKGWHLLTSWFDHLLLSATGQLTAPQTSRLITTDSSLYFTPLNEEEAKQHLQVFGQLFIEGRQRPLPVFPAASFDWACQADEEKARKKVWGNWENQFNQYSSGDDSDAYIALLLRDGAAPPFDEAEFGELSKQLYAAALQHGSEHG